MLFRSFVTNRDRVAHREAFSTEAAAVFRSRPTDEWLKRLHAEGVPAAPILSVDDVLVDPQVVHREMVVEMDHPKHGIVPTLGTPIKFDPPEAFTPAPPAMLGQHTDSVLGELLQYSADRVAALRKAGVVK